MLHRSRYDMTGEDERDEAQSSAGCEERSLSEIGALSLSLSVLASSSFFGVGVTVIAGAGTGAGGAAGAGGGASAGADGDDGCTSGHPTR